MADSADDGYVKIGAFIDPTGATEGADQVVSEVNKIEGATDAGADKIDTSMLRNRRSVGHLLRGLMEMGQGGEAAIGGLAAEGFVATEAFEAMLGPLAPILIGITLITSMAVPMLMRAQEHKEKIDETKKSSDELTKSFEAQGTASVKSLSEAQAVQAVIEASFKRMAEYGVSVTSLLGKAIDLQKKLNEDALKGREIDELSQNTGGAAGEALIKQKYAELLAGNGERADYVKGEIEVAHAVGVQTQHGDDYARIQEDRDAKQAQLDKIEADIHRTKIGAESAGFDAGEKGDYAEAIAAAQKAKAEAVKHYKDRLAAGVIRDQDPEELGKVRDAQQALDRATDAAKAVSQAKTGENLKDDIAKDQAQLDDLKNKEAEQAATIQNLQQQNRELLAAAQVAERQRALDNRKENQKLALTDLSTDTKTAINGLEGTAGNKELPAEQREAAIKQVAELTAKEFEAKATAGALPGPGNLSADEIALLRSEAKKARD